jgi:hypothetical protein
MYVFKHAKELIENKQIKIEEKILKENSLVVYIKVKEHTVRVEIENKGTRKTKKFSCDCNEMSNFGIANGSVCSHIIGVLAYLTLRA